MQNNKSLIPVFFLIPDLTGFTRFITSTDTNFAQKVIPNILNKIISADKLDMSIAEIEGDAIFFYRTGRLPAVGSVAKQCKHIYDTFNETISSYKLSDPENYEEFLSNNHLGIKVIIHFGYISLMRIKGRVKLFGEDVILAHKLLKNSINEPCYILLTDSYMEKLRNKKVVKDWFNWQDVKDGSDTYEHFGKVKYSYLSFKYCKDTSKKKSRFLKSSLHKESSLS